MNPVNNALDLVMFMFLLFLRSHYYHDYTIWGKKTIIGIRRRIIIIAARSDMVPNYITYWNINIYVS